MKEFAVTEVVTCPYRYRYQLVTEEGRRAMDVGDAIHFLILEDLHNKGYEVEVPVEFRFDYDGEEVVLKGRIDAIKNNTIYEIKSTEFKYYYIRQLLLYRDLLYVTTGKRYRIGWIFYRKQGNRVRYKVQPILDNYNLDYGEYLRYVMTLIAWYIRKGYPVKLRDSYCIYCPLLNQCKADGEWRYLVMMTLNQWFHDTYVKCYVRRGCFKECE
ncbi:MAG: hypothetical protein DRJ18_02230 [Candidatus Methanomethylicota archaeon]|nr:MAG: hypothetical protein DRJ18_02230 [Candidatus Verstraetearchaeota archaeon]